MKINGKITFLVGTEYTTIDIIDDDASTTFVKVKLTPEQLSSALSRLCYTDCEVEVNNLHKVGKKMEHKSFEMKIPVGIQSTNINEVRLIFQNEVDKLNEGWISDGRFASQNSFFKKNDEYWARETIRRWI